MLQLCDPCAFAHEHPYYRFPVHLVHPEHEKPGVLDTSGVAKCRGCGALWRFTVRNTFELVD